MADSAGASSAKPKHLDEVEKPSLSASQHSQTSSSYICLMPTVLNGLFHLHAVKHADERQIPFPNSAKNLGTGKTQCFL